MSEEEGGHDTFEERLRALARELGQSVERITGPIDRDEVADRIGTSGERVRELAEFAGRWLKAQTAEPGSSERGDAGERRLRRGGPHPRDVPTEEQGLALSALDSGRWKLDAETNELVADGEGPGPSPRAGLVEDLRVRDWITAGGEVTLVGRAALRRWEDGPPPS